jgi:glycosyltransferase involved in cell wall biosynthesis
MGSWGYHATTSKTRSFLKRGVGRMVWHTTFYLAKGLELTRRKGRYDAIVAYGPFKTAWVGLLLKALTGSKLIVQIPSNPSRSFDYYRGTMARFKAWLLRNTISTLMRFTDHLHLLYPTQTEGIPVEDLPPASVFPDFVATALVPADRGREGFILFLGFPWRLKGVDILIRAFNQVSPEFPDIVLKIVGHCPDPSPFRELAGGNPRVELHHRSLPHHEAMDLMSRCDFFVLPSRTEGMGRVIHEAWAAGKAVVGSSVDGIPHYIQHGVNGLLFPSEDAEELARALKALLEDPDEARRMGSNGRQLVETRFGEGNYARCFFEMVRSTVAG